MNPTMEGEVFWLMVTLSLVQNGLTTRGKCGQFFEAETQENAGKVSLECALEKPARAIVPSPVRASDDQRRKFRKSPALRQRPSNFLSKIVRPPLVKPFAFRFFAAYDRACENH